MYKRELTIEEKYRQSTRVIMLIIILLTVFAWGYLILQNTSSSMGMVMDMGAESEQMETEMAQRSLAALTSVSVPPFGMFVPMWFIMCIAMMLPTAIPMVLAINKICMKHAQQRQGFAYGPVWSFVFAYCLLWLLFGVACWIAGRLGFQLIGSWISNWKNLWLCVSLLLLLCGIYQLSPLKNACLKGCQHPLMFAAKYYKPGNIGAFRMGLRHGGECIGCCLALMVVMFPLGMMNIVWMGLFTVLMYEEKNAKFGTVLSKVAGWILVVAGGCSAITSIVVLIL